MLSGLIIAYCRSGGAFCNTFDLHYATTWLYDHQFLSGCLRQEIFAKVLYAKVCEIKSWRNGDITLLFTDVGNLSSWIVNKH